MNGKEIIDRLERVSASAYDSLKEELQTIEERLKMLERAKDFAEGSIKGNTDGTKKAIESLAYRLEDLKHFHTNTLDTVLLWGTFFGIIIAVAGIWLQHQINQKNRRVAR